MLDTLEQPLLRVPAEALRKAARERKALLESAQGAVAAALDPSAVQGGEQGGGHSAQGQAEKLDLLQWTLQGMKRKLGEVSDAEKAEAGRCKARLDHLQVLTQPRPSAVAWNKQRLDKLLVDHLNRYVCCVRVCTSSAFAVGTRTQSRVLS